jgi:DNA-binding NarL/FixJ family response regulator
MTNRAPISVLVVDDSSRIRTSLRQMMEPDPRFGKLLEAANATEGFSLFELNRPDAVVLDLQLPDLNGLEVLKMMKAAHPAAVVVVLTSHNEPEIREECRRRGADWFIEKAPGLATVASSLLWLCFSSQRTRSSAIQERGDSPIDSARKRRVE